MRQTAFAVAFSLLSLQAYAAEVKFAKPDPSQPYLSDAMKNPAIRKPIAAMITTENLPHWVKGIVKNRNYVATPPLVTEAPVPGAIVYNACQEHDCAENKISILVTPHRNHAFALLKEGKNMHFFGHPKEPVEEILRAAIVQ